MRGCGRGSTGQHGSLRSEWFTYCNNGIPPDRSIAAVCKACPFGGPVVMLIHVCCRKRGRYAGSPLVMHGWPDMEAVPYLTTGARAGIVHDPLPLLDLVHVKAADATPCYTQTKAGMLVSTQSAPELRPPRPTH